MLEEHYFMIVESPQEANDKHIKYYSESYYFYLLHQTIALLINQLKDESMSILY